jgi:hypothetical protein
MARPTFFIIGAMKGGTTSLHGYLGEHPQIQMTAIKETNFFAGPPRDNPYMAGEERVAGLAEYEALFDPAAEVRGEASPSYTMYPRRPGVPERIREVVPEAKFVYVVRDPLDRLVSHYLHSLSFDGEERSLREALGDYSDPECPFTCPGFYAVQMERYLDRFPAERVLVVDQADLLDRRRETLREIFAFLGVDPEFVSPRFEEERNTGHDLRGYSDSLVALKRLRSRVSPVWLALPEGARANIRGFARRTLAPPLERPEEALDPVLREELVELYAPDTARLRELTGMALPSWSV